MKVAVLSVNLGSVRSIATKSGVSGIYKSAQTEPVMINAEGLAGDIVIDRENHGGVDQAVYIYCQDDYDWWQQREGLVTEPGHFGENLTVSGMSTADAHIGARFIGDTVTLEITSPRTPCDTFAARMNDPSFPKRFWASRRTGFYCRVISQGYISAGQTMDLKPHVGPHVTIQEWIENEPLSKQSAAFRQRILSVPLHEKARQSLSQL